MTNQRNGNQRFHIENSFTLIDWIYAEELRDKKLDLDKLMPDKKNNTSMLDDK